MGHLISLLARFPISGCAYLSLQLEQRRWQKRYPSYQGNGYDSCHSWRSMSTHTWGADLACGHLGPHGGCHSSCCLSKSKTKNHSAKEIWMRTAPSSGQVAHAWQRGLVIVHGLIALFFGVVALAIILLVVRLGALWVIVIVSRAIVALIVLMTIVGLTIVAVTSVTSIVVVIFMTTMLMVAQFMVTHDRKMSHFLFLWLLLVLGNLHQK